MNFNSKLPKNLWNYLKNRKNPCTFCSLYKLKCSFHHDCLNNKMKNVFGLKTWKMQVGIFEFMIKFSIKRAMLHNFSILIMNVKITDKKFMYWSYLGLLVLFQAFSWTPADTIKNSSSDNLEQQTDKILSVSPSVKLHKYFSPSAVLTIIKESKWKILICLYKLPMYSCWSGFTDGQNLP
jgi:hypothetical protein